MRFVKNFFVLLFSMLAALPMMAGGAAAAEGPQIEPLISNDATLFGILLVILAFVFYTSHSQNPNWKKFYKFVPALLLCYFLPSMLTAIPSLANLINEAMGSDLRATPWINAEESKLYFVASRYLLPTSLILLTLSIDLKGIIRLGPKAGIMFLTGTLGIVIGGPIAILIVSTFSPETVGGMGPEAVWRGLSTVAGSWIGEGANQTAMKEVWEVGDKVFSAMIAVDVIVANVWMAVLLYGAGINKKIDARTGADTSAIEDLKARVEDYQKSINKIPTLTDAIVLLGVGFGVTGLSHFLADIVSGGLGDYVAGVKAATGAETHWLSNLGLTGHFFWLIFFATTGGLILSFTKARRLEGFGASRMGSVFLYILVATIGMKMDVTQIFRMPMLFLVGGIWMLIHAGLMLGVGRLIKAPFFFIAVGSQANVGGAASAPVVASAFHPSLATVGVLLAVFGYALGTYCAWLCAILMKTVAPVTETVM